MAKRQTSFSDVYDMGARTALRQLADILRKLQIEYSQESQGLKAHGDYADSNHWAGRASGIAEAQREVTDFLRAIETCDDWADAAEREFNATNRQ